MFSLILLRRDLGGCMGIFSHCTAVLELNDISSGEKNILRKKFESNGGLIAFSLAREKTSFVITTMSQWKKQTFKLRNAQKLSIPVVDMNFVDGCLQKGKLLPTFLYAPRTLDRSLENETNDSTSIEDSVVPFMTRTPSKPPIVTPIDYVDINDHNYSIAAQHFLLKAESKHGHYCALELHVHRSLGDNKNEGNHEDSNYRVFIHTGSTKELLSKATKQNETEKWQKVGIRKVSLLSNITDAESLYESILLRYQEKLSYRPFHVISPKIGSSLASTQVSASTNFSFLQKSVQELVVSIYEASDAKVDKLLDTTAHKALHSMLGQLSPQDIEKAETALYQLWGKFNEKGNTTPFQEEYCVAMFHDKNACTIRSMDDIVKHQHICQLLKDRLCCNEGLDSGCLVDRQFVALSCDIQPLSKRHPSLFQELVGKVEEAARQAAPQKIIIQEIFQLRRDIESFAHDIDNVHMLFHGTSPGNLLGLLSRGLLLPNGPEAAWYMKGQRRDAGMLGAGIYFTDDTNTAAQYCSPVHGYRYMFIADVALGKVWDTNSFDTSLLSPPHGYQSVHGVKGTEFKDDEFVVYHEKQQALRYLIRFSFQHEEIDTSFLTDSTEEQNIQLEKILSSASEFFVREDEEKTKAEIEVEEQVEDIPTPIEVEAGLQCSSGKKIPLQCTHIRSTVLDLVGTVKIFQKYVNESEQPIEAKYLFPLDEKGAVCGFEAFINGKHVIGEVKEKEKAHKEYKEAIEKGHGAYLMDQQEKPDVWTVSVGNLPPHASVIIKITYVTELDVEGDDIIFRFPANLSGQADVKKAMQEVTQTSMSSILTEASKEIPQSFGLTFEMPYEILCMLSPTHPEVFVMKATDTKGSIAMKESVTSLGGMDLEFRITLANAYQPRMWIEEQTSSPEGSKSHRAAMVCFYPKFDFSPQLDNEFLFLVDRSASMGAKGMLEAGRLMNLFLQKLPSHCYFNIFGFGCSVEELFFTSQLNTSENIHGAKKWLSHHLKANLGSTDLFSLLSRLYLRVHTSRAPRHIIILSDGQFHHYDDLIDLVQNNASHSRLFTCGLTSHPSRHALYSLACAGRGSSELFHSKVSMQYNDREKVCRLLGKAIQPAISNVTMDWIGDATTIQQAPASILSVFHGEKKVIYGMLGPELCSQAILSSQGADGEQINTRVASHTVGATRNPHDMVHKLATRALLRDFEEGAYARNARDNALLKAKKKQEMIELSCAYNVVFSLTSFLAVEERDNKNTDVKSTPLLDDLLNEEMADLIDYMAWGEGMDAQPHKLMSYRKEMQNLDSRPSYPSSTPQLSITTTQCHSATTEHPIQDTGKLSSLDILLANIQSDIQSSLGTPSIFQSSSGAFSTYKSSVGVAKSSMEELDQLMESLDEEMEHTVKKQGRKGVREQAVLERCEMDEMNLLSDTEQLDQLLKEMDHINFPIEEEELDQLMESLDEEMEQTVKKQGECSASIKKEKFGERRERGKAPVKKKKLKKSSKRTPASPPSLKRMSRRSYQGADTNGNRYMKVEEVIAPQLAFEEAPPMLYHAPVYMVQNEIREAVAMPAVHEKVIYEELMAELQPLQLVEELPQLQMQMQMQMQEQTEVEEILMQLEENRIGKEVEMAVLSSSTASKELYDAFNKTPYQEKHNSFKRKKKKIPKGSTQTFSPTSPSYSPTSPSYCLGPPRTPSAPGAPPSSSPMPMLGGRRGMGGRGAGRGRGGRRAIPVYSPSASSSCSSSSIPISARRSSVNMEVEEEEDDCDDWGDDEQAFTQVEKKRDVMYHSYAMQNFQASNLEEEQEQEYYSSSDSESEDTSEPQQVRLFGKLLKKKPGMVSKSQDKKKKDKKEKKDKEIQFALILDSQNAAGYWEMSSSIEKKAGIPCGYLTSLLNAAYYKNMGESSSDLIERLFITAMIIELLLSDDRWKTSSSVERAIEWLTRKEREEISTCYQLGLSSHWRAYAKQVWSQISFEEDHNDNEGDKFLLHNTQISF